MFTPLAFNKESIVTRGLLMYLDAADRSSFSPGSGVWNDLTGTEASASILNGTTYTPNYSGGFIFDSTDDYMDVGSAQDIFNQTWPNGLTLQIVISVDEDLRLASDGMALIARSNGGADANSFNFSLQVRGSITHPDHRKLRFWITHFTDSFLISSTKLTETRPYVCVAVYDPTTSPSTTKLYIDGQFDNSRTTTITPTLATRGVYIGGGGNAFSGWEFDGSIYTVNAYNRALTPSEISQNYNALKGRFGL